METLRGVLGWNNPEAKKDEPVKYNTEFHQVRYEFIDKDLGSFIEKYPLITLVSTVFFFFFGLMNVLSFSPTNILTGLFLITLAVCFGTGIVRKGWPFWSGLKDSIGKVLTIHTEVNTKAEDSKPAPQS